MTVALEPGEELLVEVPLHPLKRFPNLGFSASVVAATALIIARNELAPSTIAILCAAAAVLIAMSSVMPYRRRRGFALAVTTRRLVVRTGDGRVREFDRQRLGQVEVEQGPWGRLVGYASVGIVPPDGVAEVFAGVARPEALRSALARRVRGGRRPGVSAP